MKPQSVGKGYKPQNTQKTQKGLNQEFFSACSAYSAVLQHFDQISEAPDAIPRLRRFILDLAVRGKLVEQNPNDEPATELLKRIEKERRHLEKASQSRKDKYFLPIKEDEIPFSVPASWIWVRLGDITIYIQRGKSPQYATGYGPLVISQKCIQWDGLHMEWAKSLVPESLKNYEPVRFLQDGDLLWNSTGTGTIGRVIRVDQPPEPQVCDSHVTVIRCLHVYELFVLIWLRSDYVYGTIEGRAIGATKQVELTASMANSQITPLPPFAEQHRIVAKGDELMTLCDNLEAAQQNRERRRDRLVTASLAKLTDEAENKSIIKFSVSSACSAVSRPEHIHQLRQTILNLAVRGKLVPQNPKDEPVVVLLKRIQLEKRKLFETRSIGSQKSSNRLNANEIPFTVPRGWGWVRVGDVGFTQTGNTPSKTHSEYFGNHIPFIKPADLNGNSINYIGEGISKEGIKFARLIPKNSVLMVCIGSTIGKVNVADRDVCCNQQINTITPYLQELVAFLAFAFKADFFQKLLRFNAGTGTLPIISKGKWEKLPIPLPPLCEQKRIVARVDKFMALCDGMEASIKNTTTTRHQLLEATLQEAIGFM